jgi:hypothetical protein
MFKKRSKSSCKRANISCMSGELVIIPSRGTPFIHKEEAFKNKMGFNEQGNPPLL